VICSKPLNPPIPQRKIRGMFSGWGDVKSGTEILKRFAHRDINGFKPVYGAVIQFDFIFHQSLGVGCINT
jgi:hypothetical protein